jgi:hypothetical protein
MPAACSILPSSGERLPGVDLPVAMPVGFCSNHTNDLSATRLLDGGVVFLNGHCELRVVLGSTPIEGSGAQN